MVCTWASISARVIAPYESRRFSVPEEDVIVKMVDHPEEADLDLRFSMRSLLSGFLSE
jgi:hypothetical protein